MEKAFRLVIVLIAFAGMCYSTTFHGGWWWATPSYMLFGMGSIWFVEEV